MVTLKTSIQLILGYCDVNTRRKLSALSCDEKLLGINKIPVNTASAEIRGPQNTGISFFFVNTGPGEQVRVPEDLVGYFKCRY
jgi:hypothetical protein